MAAGGIYQLIKAMLACKLPQYHRYLLPISKPTLASSSPTLTSLWLSLPYPWLSILPIAQLFSQVSQVSLLFTQPSLAMLCSLSLTSSTILLSHFPG